MDPRLICSQLGSLCWRRVCCFLSRHRTNLVMTKTLLSAVCTTSVLLFASQVAAQVSITPLASFGTNGWLAPGSTPYLTTGNTERGLACNPLTGNLVLVARQNVAGVSNNVRLFDGQTGADLGGFDNTNIAGGTFPMNMVDIAEDGAIYVCNLSTSGASPFKVYRWDSELLGPLLPPTAVYDGLSGLGRTGDAFAVQGGSLANPVQFAAAGGTTVSASNFVIGTLDTSNFSTPYLSVPGTGTASNDYRLGLTFVDADTLIGNQGGLARMTSFDPTTATVDASIPLGGAARRAMDYAVIGNTPVLAVIDTNSSDVTIYNITDPTAPVVLGTANNTLAPLSPNANGVGSVQWGAISGNTALLYAMSTNQGIQAFQVVLSPLAGVSTFGVGCDGLVLSANGQPSLGNTAFELAVANVPAVSPAAFVAFGTTSTNPGVDLTAVGMPGCFGYTSFDIGVFTTGTLVSGTGVLPLAVPSGVNFAGFTVAVQGLSFSLTTALNLASSNGAQIQFGF